MRFHSPLQAWTFGMLATGVLLTSSSALLAQEAPFTGVVTQDQTEIRAGAGRTFYIVGQASKGDLVKVEELVFGWYKIQPPASTFSYVRKAFVNVKGDGSRGEINADRTRVTAGGLEGPGVSFRRQVDLAKGDPIEILGEDGDSYRIRPPKDAFVFLAPGTLRKATAADLEPPVPAPAATGQGATTGSAGTALKPMKPEGTGATPDAAPGHSTGQADPIALKPAPVPKPIANPIPPKPAPEAVPAVAGTVPVEGTRPAPLPEPAPAHEPVRAAKPAPAPDAAPASAPVLFENAEATFQNAITQPLEQQPLAELTTLYNSLSTQRLTARQQQVVALRLSHLKRNQQLRDALQGVSQAKAVKEISPYVEPADQARFGPVPKYDAMGRLLASAVYDGSRLPRLFRIVDPNTQRTVAYVRPSSVVDPLSSLGQVVGVFGKLDYDASLNLQVLTVDRLDLLNTVDSAISPDKAAKPAAGQ